MSSEFNHQDGIFNFFLLHAGVLFMEPVIEKSHFFSPIPLCSDALVNLNLTVSLDFPHPSQNQLLSV